MMKRDIRLVLARVLEHYVKDAMLTGLFSVVDGSELKYEFAIAGEKKLALRKQLPQKDYLSMMIPILASEFEDRYGVKPSLVIEWYIGPEAIAQGVELIAEEIERHALNECKGYTVPPEDLGDMDYEYCHLRPA